MRIDADGRWYYCGSEIRRPAMVRLFSTVLRRDPDGFVLVTPAEKLEIDVEDAPFVAVDVEARGAGEAQELAFATNVGDIVIASEQHALRVRGVPDSPRPYLEVRQGLDALVARSVYYRLVDLAVERRDQDATVVGVWSSGTFFPIGRYA